MSDNTKIEWTDATWNIITGCSVVSAGCKNCYAMKLAGTRLQHHPSRAGLTTDTSAGPVWNGEVRFNEQWLDQPLRWKRLRKIFVCAHGDLFHEKVPDEWINNVFEVMALCPQHIFQVLTKRPERMLDYMNSKPFGKIIMLGGKFHPGTYIAPMTWPLANVWLGVSVENQETADERIPLLLQTPAAVRWVSAEPLLGNINLSHLNEDKETNELDCLKPYTWADEIENWQGTSDEWKEEFLDWYDLVDMPEGLMHAGIDWLIVGGESGRNARPMHPDWARSLRDQCKAAGVPFLFKQWGEWFPRAQWEDNPDLILPDDDCAYENSDKIIVIESDDGPEPIHRVGKKAAGRLLDGVLHDEYPGKP